jgi:UDP-2,4-diacetamido-2,4,6-trideoxy-beta-L-altropyranose hydrolase
MDTRGADGQGRAVFRVDAGPTIGLGHLRRCLALATELHDRNCDLRFVSRDRFGPDVEALVAPFAIHWLGDTGEDQIPRDAADGELWDAAATLAVTGPARSPMSWVIVDHYRLGHRWERTIREAGHRILAIDDYRNRRHCADLLVSDSLAPFNPSLNELTDGSRALAGRPYALVHRDYAFTGSVAATIGPKTMLMTYGGSDPTSETLKAMEAIRMLRLDREPPLQLGRVDIAVGSANPRTADITRAAQSITDVIVHQNLSSLARVMRQADIILTAGGNSLVEALTLRTPCIVTVTADNQAQIVSELESEGVIRSLGEHAAVTPDDIRTMLVSALADYSAFASRVRACSLFDHLGAGRIANEMLLLSGRVGR